MPYCFYKNWRDGQEGQLNLEFWGERRRADQVHWGPPHEVMSLAQCSQTRLLYLCDNSLIIDLYYSLTKNVQQRFLVFLKRCENCRVNISQLLSHILPHLSDSESTWLQGQLFWGHSVSGISQSFCPWVRDGQGRNPDAFVHVFIYPFICPSYSWYWKQNTSLAKW